MRNGFTFYRSRLEMLEGLDDKTFRNLIEAILEKGLNDKDIELLGIAKNLFIPVKPILEKEYKKYLNGAKGGAPKGNSNAVKNGGFNIKQPKNNQKQANEKGIMNNVEGINNKLVENDNLVLNKNDNDDVNVKHCADLTFDKIYKNFYRKSGHKQDIKKSKKIFDECMFSENDIDKILLDESIFKIEYRRGVKDQMYRPKFDTYIQSLNLDNLNIENRIKAIAKKHYENINNGKAIDRYNQIKELPNELKIMFDSSFKKIASEGFRINTY